MSNQWESVIEFWFVELSAKQWFSKDRKLDATIRERFLIVHERATQGECWQWRDCALGRLAEIIVLDQFSRNIFRDDTRAFAQDSLALVLAQEAVANNADKQLDTQQRAFLYMPYMHSESLQVHEEAVKLFAQEGLENNYDFELKHKKIIERFGRYPHRNDVLGRASTAIELEFLSQPGSSF